MNQNGSTLLLVTRRGRRVIPIDSKDVDRLIRRLDRWFMSTGMGGHQFTEWAEWYTETDHSQGWARLETKWDAA